MVLEVEVSYLHNHILKAYLRIIFWLICNQIGKIRRNIVMFLIYIYMNHNQGLFLAFFFIHVYVPWALKIYIGYKVKSFPSFLCFVVSASNRDVEQLHNHIIHYLYSISCGRTKLLHKMLRDTNYIIVMACI